MVYQEGLTADELREIGIEPARVIALELFHKKHGNRLYRIRYGPHSFVLKWFQDPTPAEVQSYALLEELGVPTLPVYGRTSNALLLEDLATSSEWRLATPDDVERAETGVAVAQWYQALHKGGRRLLADPFQTPDFLHREVETLNAATILQMGRKLDLADNPVWMLAADHIEALKSAMRSCAETLNYNDFHWTNLALSRQERLSLRAIVYDYHLLGIGLRYSDYRNVASSLKGRARAAFWEACEPVDEIERILDEPTSILFALSVALQRPSFPSWAADCLDQVKSGDFEKCLLRALEVI